MMIVRTFGMPIIGSSIAASAFTLSSTVGNSCTDTDERAGSPPLLSATAAVIAGGTGRAPAVTSIATAGSLVAISRRANRFPSLSSDLHDSTAKGYKHRTGEQ